MEIIKGKIGNALTSTASDHVVAVTHDIYDESLEQYQDDINNVVVSELFELEQVLCCFSTGFWENDIRWSNQAQWNNNIFVLTDELQSQIDELQRIDEEYGETFSENELEHQSFKLQLQTHLDRLNTLQTLTEEHDSQILDLLNGLNCFGDGQWHNDLKWSNDALWENSNLMCETFADVYAKIEEHRQNLINLNQEINNVKTEAETTLQSIELVFAGFRKEHEDFKKEHETFRSEHNSINERISGVISHQKDNDTLDTEQQRQIDSLLLSLSLITNGIWNNDLLWVNEAEWTNYKGVGEGQDRIDGLYDELAETNERLNQTDLEVANNTALIEDNANLIGINRNDILQCISDIQDNADAIENNAQDIADNAEKIEGLRQDFIKEHRDVAYQLRAIGREQTAQDENLLTLGSHFGCFVDGLWGDMFVWDNDHLWANEPGVVKSALDEHTEQIKQLDKALTQTRQNSESNRQLIDTNIQSIEQHQKDIEKCQSDISNNAKDIQSNSAKISDNSKNISHNSDEIEAVKESAIQERRDTAYKFRAIEREQSAQDERMEQIGSHFGCFVDGLWGDMFVWDNDHLWANEPGVVASMQEELSSQDTRLSALETALAQLLEINKAQQVQIEKQQSQLDALMDVFTVTNIGLWQNALLWNNDTKWSDSLITEQIETGGSGTATVSVLHYDEENQAVSI